VLPDTFGQASYSQQLIVPVRQLFARIVQWNDASEP
jgi:hypothetical protein